MVLICVLPCQIGYVEADLHTVHTYYYTVIFHIYLYLQSDNFNALHLAVEQEDMTTLHIVEFIASNS